MVTPPHVVETLSFDPSRTDDAQLGVRADLFKVNNRPKPDNEMCLMIENDQIDGLDGWFQPWSEHNVATRPLVSVGGTYTVHTSRLSEAQLAELGAILLALPGAQSGSMSFFASSTSAGLEASFEPSGITVSGEVSASDWEAWDFAFRSAVEVAKLPRFPA